MREVRIVSLCDVCLGDTAGDAKVEAVITMAFFATDGDGSKREIDLCETHLEQNSIERMWSDSRAFVSWEEVDIPPATARARPRQPCTVCGEYFSVGSGMALHRKTHVKG